MYTSASEVLSRSSCSLERHAPFTLAIAFHPPATELPPHFPVVPICAINFKGLSDLFSVTTTWKDLEGELALFLLFDRLIEWTKSLTWASCDARPFRFREESAEICSWIHCS